MRLQDKVAIITGSGSGFGRAAAVRFAEEGARVVVVDIDADGGSETVKRIAAAGSQGELVVADVADRRRCQPRRRSCSRALRRHRRARQQRGDRAGLRR